MRLILHVVCVSFALAGCTTSHLTLDEGGRVVIHHWGYARIVKPPLVPSDKQMNVTGYKLMGFSVGEGVTLGYKSNEIIQVPADCRVLVVVGNENQFEHLLDHIDVVGATDLCATMSPE